MKNKKSKWIKLTILISVLLIISTVTFVVYAEFTKSLRARRVISTTDGDSALFSSNYLSPQNDYSISKRFLPVESVGTSASAEITICNYAQDNTTEIYGRDIKYDVVITLVNEDGNALDASSIDEGLTVTVSSGSSNIELSKNVRTYTFDNSGSHYTMQALIKTTNKLIVTFSNSFNSDSNVYLKVEANLYPNESNYLGVNDLIALFKPMVINTTEVTGWTGVFNEKTGEDDPTPDELDGFNYVITGNGVGNIKLAWDTRYLDISQQFLIKNELIFDHTDDGYVFTDGNMKYLTFDVDSSATDRYDLQFYKSSLLSPSDYDSWSKLNGYITCKFTSRNP